MTVSAEMMKGTVVPITLKLLAEREMYGYEIIKEVNARTNGVLQWKEASLYPWLHRLEQDGLIDSHWVENEGQRRRKYYGITKKGIATLTQQAAEWSELSGAVTAILSSFATC
jgi:PadR family transcriptional regulator, regulatory protein PadR